MVRAHPTTTGSMQVAKTRTPAEELQRQADVAARHKREAERQLMATMKARKQLVAADPYLDEADEDMADLENRNFEPGPDSE